MFTLSDIPGTPRPPDRLESVRKIGELAALMAQACRLTLSQAPSDPVLLGRVLRDLEQAAASLKDRADALTQPGPDDQCYDLCDLVFHVARLVDVLPARPVRAILPLQPIAMASAPDPLFSLLGTLVAHLRDAGSRDGQILIGCQPCPLPPSSCNILIGKMPVAPFVQLTIVDQAAGDLAEVATAIEAAKIPRLSASGHETALAAAFGNLLLIGGAVTVQCARRGVGIFRIYWPTGSGQPGQSDQPPLLLTQRVA
jgi:hypothetical protein